MPETRIFRCWNSLVSTCTHDRGVHLQVKLAASNQSFKLYDYDMRGRKVFRVEKSIGGEITRESAQLVRGERSWSQDLGLGAADRS